ANPVLRPVRSKNGRNREFFKPNKALHLTGRAVTVSQSCRSSRPAPQVNLVVRLESVLCGSPENLSGVRLTKGRSRATRVSKELCLSHDPQTTHYIKGEVKWRRGSC